MFFIAHMMNLITFWLSDRIVIGMFRGRPASPTQYPELHRMVDNLSGAALIIQMALSRTGEYRADRMGAYLSGRPLNLASALEKLQLAARRRPLGGNLSYTSHLFIVNPFQAGFLFRIFSTHPSTEERVKRLRTLAGVL